MKAALSCFATLLLSSMLWAQAGTTAQDQPSADPNQPATVTAQQVKALEDALAAQQKQIDEQRQQLEAMRQQLAQQGTPHVADASLHTGLGDSSSRAVVSDAGGPQEAPKESPLSFRIGNTDFTPGGFVDFTTVFRSTNVGSGIGTNFFSIPYSNTVAGHLTETRLSPQNSRVSLKVHGVYGANDVTGYLEADFLGNDATNVFVTSNGHTNRLRLYWVDLHRGRWEFLGGQSWSFLTPNRVGVSPLPGDIFFTNNMDTNYQVGLTWTRAAQIRVVYHPTDHWAVGLAVENPEQFVGQAGEIVFPFAFNAVLSGQFDPTNNSTGTPNLHPDLIPKVAYDTDWNGKHFHAEAVGLVTSVKAAFIPVGVPAATFQSAGTTGFGGGGAVNLEFAKGYHFVANGFYSYGGGRYIFGLGPQAVVVPIPTGPGSFIMDTSLVHTGSGIAGLEAQVTKNNLLTAYYGAAYFQRNTFPDVTNPVAQPLHVCATGQALTTKPCIGFGGINEAGAANMNRALQEGTVGWIYTFWSNKNYGKMQLITQASYITRAPWFVAAGAPKNAHAFMAWADVRYTLP